MTATVKCKQCGEHTSDPVKKGGEYFCRSHALTQSEGVQHGECVTCGDRVPLFISYMGWKVGWYCEEHRPDKGGRPAKVDDILETFKWNRVSIGLDEKLELKVLPNYFAEKGHPFNKVARELVDKGYHAFDTSTRAEMMAPPPVELNREQRRHLQREHSKKLRKGLKLV